MKNYNRTDYALNKFSENIVNNFVTGIEEITLDDFLTENPDKSAEDFAEIKGISDTLYYEELLNTRSITRLDVSINTVHINKLVCDVNILDEIIKAEDTIKICKATKEFLEKGNLTNVEKRRFIKYYFQGISKREIGRNENVSHTAINKTIKKANEKLKKYFY